MTKHPLRYRIPVAAPDLSPLEHAYVSDAVSSGWISSTGPYIERAEHLLASLCGTRAAVLVSNGTVALHLAMLALDVRAGDEVIVPSLTYVATANAVRYVGAEPVFVDVDPSTWCLDPAKIEEAITPRTRGIIAVHLYGHPADMDAINRIADLHGLWVVEDAAEAPLAAYKGRPAGSLGRLATFSFYGNKIFSCGEGGAVTVSEPVLESRIRRLKGQGVDPERRYYFPIIGYNYRLSNVAAAILCAQLERKEELLRRRREIFSRYLEGLCGLEGIEPQPVADWAVPSPWLFSVLVDPHCAGISRDALIERLEEQGIETRPLFLPLHTLPPYREAARARGLRLPVTEELARSGLNLPTYPSLSNEQIDFICEAVRSAVAAVR